MATVLLSRHANSFLVANDTVNPIALERDR